MTSQQIGDLISREDTLTAFADYVGSGMSMNDFDALWDIVAKMPPVNLQEQKTDMLDKIKVEIRKHCEYYMDGDIIADEVIQAVENIVKAESEEA